MKTPIRPPKRFASCVASLALLVATGADATVVCGKLDAKTGHVRDGSAVHVRNACRPSEVQLDAAALGLQVLGTLTVRTGNTISTNGIVSTSAICNPGEVATGGGLLGLSNDGGQPVLRSTRPEPDTAGATPTSWRSTAANLSTTGTITVTAYAVCAAP